MYINVTGLLFLIKLNKLAVRSVPKCIKIYINVRSIKLPCIRNLTLK